MNQTNSSENFYQEIFPCSFSSILHSLILLRYLCLQNLVIDTPNLSLYGKNFDQLYLMSHKPMNRKIAVSTCELKLKFLNLLERPDNGV